LRKAISCTEDLAFSGGFIYVDDDFENASEIAEGLFVSIYYHRDEEKQAYEKLIEFIENGEHVISGDAIELAVVNYLLSDTAEDYMFKIEIPIKSLAANVEE
jgi:effector-binding domain-containing protein